MWQQVDGGKNDLFTWVAVTSGEGSRKRDDPSSGTNQGGVAMGFYSMIQGDAPYLRELAQTYAIADNYHQAVMGGTGANFVALSTGHVLVYLEEGRPAAPPTSQIENPDPRPGTNNWYTKSGYRERIVCRLRRRKPAGRRGDPGLPFVPAVQNIQRRELRARQLLPGEQLRHRLHLRRQAEGARQLEVRRAAADRPQHRNRARPRQRLVEVV